MKKTKSLEKEINLIMNKYHFDIYNKQLYIKNCSKAIEKVVLDMVGEDEEEDYGGEGDIWSNHEANDTKQEIRDKILGDLTEEQKKELSENLSNGR